MSGASWRATEAAARGRATRTPSPRAMRLPDTTRFSRSVAPTPQSSRRSIRLARLALERRAEGARFGSRYSQTPWPSLVLWRKIAEQVEDQVCAVDGKRTDSSTARGDDGHIAGYLSVIRVQCRQRRRTGSQGRAFATVKATKKGHPRQERAPGQTGPQDAGSQRAARG